MGKQKRLTKPRVAFYTRISTDEDHQKYSLGAQKSRLKDFCNSQYGSKWTLYKVYRDTESGAHTNRPQFEEMLRNARAGLFDILLVFRIDRLSRKLRDVAWILEVLTRHSVILRSGTEPFDTATIAGKMMIQVLGIFAEFERSAMVERSHTCFRRMAQCGMYPSANAPFGYEIDPSRVLRQIAADAARVRTRLARTHPRRHHGAHQ